MECTATHKNQIQETCSNIRFFSFEEKKESSEEKMNSFLDAILDLKSHIRAKSEKLYNYTERLEKITWYDNLDDECLMLLNDIISLGRELSNSLNRQYAYYNKEFKQHGIAKDEIKELKASINDFKETCNDLEDIFFYLPQDTEFNKITQELSEL